MARAMWKGTIRFTDQEIPIKLYAAVEDRSVRFHLLNSRTGRPVKQRMVHPETGETVESERIERGYEIEEGVFVVLTPEELADLEPEASREISVTAFLEPEVINHQWYDRPYLLGPDGDARSYYALAEALAAEGKEGLAHWTMRNRDYSGALRVEDDHLVLITLRHADDIIASSSLSAPAGRAPEKPELRMARQLVEAMAGEFDLTKYRDEYRDRVLALIESKAAGKTIHLHPPGNRRETRNLTASLEASLRALKERKSA